MSAEEVYRNLQQCQWLGAAELAELTAASEARIRAHAAATTAYYRAHEPGRVVTTKADLRDHGVQAFFSDDIPSYHGAVSPHWTSGSSGEPIEIRRTELCDRMVKLANIRFFEAFRPDWRRSLARIREGLPGTSPFPDGTRGKGTWVPTFVASECGPIVNLDLATPADRQLAWLERQGPLYLNTFPSNLRAMALVQLDSPRSVDMGAAITVGEPVTGDLRALVRRAFDCEIYDQYSSTEGLLIASQCPASTYLHVQSELVKLEILRFDGSPAGLGEEGDVVVTPLVNFAMPLVRYRLEDRAAWRGVCGCGRGHPLISVEVGRERHLFHFDDGSIVFPMIRTREFMDYLKATRWQVAQTSPRSVEVRFSSTSPGARDYAAMTQAVRSHLAHDVEVSYRLMETWPPNDSGKLPECIREF
ncbi:MAG TPA: hypothetical protein VJS40_03930 [Aestuariivirgaceae bacterium]|nr:hypothetical protein [Aestuariivirgaceae bacterium]